MTFPWEFMLARVMLREMDLILVSRRPMVRLGVSNVGVGEFVQGLSSGQQKVEKHQDRWQDLHLPSLSVSQCSQPSEEES